MPAKKIGTAVFDLKTELWTTGRGSQRFHMNRRLVEKRPEVKSFQREYSKAMCVNTPSRREPERRKKYFETKDLYEKKWQECLKQVAEDIKAESFRFPVPLRLDRDFEHNSDWRYCLFHGAIYLFDKPGYSVEQMREQIETLEGINLDKSEV